MSKSVIEVDGERALVHVRHELVTGVKGSRTYFLPFRDNTTTYMEKELDETGYRLVEALAKIPGVTRIGVGIYFFVLNSSPAFEWETEIRPEVDKVTSEILGYQSK